MTIDINGQTLALAAIFQFAEDVENLAKTGQIPQQELTTAVTSLYQLNPPKTLDVYTKVSHVSRGLEILINNLKRKPNRSNDCVRYVMGIMHLQRRLEKHNEMLSTIATRLDKSQLQAEHFSLTHENVIAGLAEIYSNTISTFSFRIQVMGEYQHLQQPRVANQIRTMLFAGVRSAVLWRQLGGRRLKIIYNRNKILHVAEKLLNDAKQERLLE